MANARAVGGLGVCLVAMALGQFLGRVRVGGQRRRRRPSVSSLVLRGLGLVYVVAFTSLRRQVLGLFGQHGIVPVHAELDAVRATADPRERPWRRWVALPTLLWLDAGDAALVRLCTVGQVSGVALVAGVAPKASAWAAWALHLSCLVVGRPFLAYQWDALLAESGLLGALAAPPGWRLRPAAPIKTLPLWLLRLLSFRLHFESGLAKLMSRDPSWRACRACAYHYETQPLPTPLAYHARQLPPWFHRASTALVLLVEITVPFLALGPRPARRLALVLLLAFQALIAATGNFAYFNLLTAIITLSLLDDDPKASPRKNQPAPIYRRLVHPLELGLSTLLATLALYELSTRVLPRRWQTHAQTHTLTRALSWLQAQPLLSVSSYGLFAHMTCSRPEIVIEGSNDGRHWCAYQLPHKPGDPSRGPRWSAPGQPRLDWQLWFAALSPFPPRWFETLMLRLLEGSPPVLALFAHNPFPDRPPRYLRAVLYDYRMTDAQTRRRSGQHWQRKPIGPYFPAVRLGGGGHRRTDDGLNGAGLRAGAGR